MNIRNILFIVFACVLSSCNQSSETSRNYKVEGEKESPSPVVQPTQYILAEQPNEKEEAPDPEPLEYKVVNIKKSGNGYLDGEVVPKFTGVVRISNDYGEYQLQQIAGEAIGNYPEISLGGCILMIEFYKEGDSLKGLNYGIAKCFKGSWETELNGAYQAMKEQERQAKENKAKYGNTWKKRSVELANGRKIVGVFEYGNNTYEMIVKKGSKYYLIEYKVDSPDTNSDELVKVGKNRFRYKEPYEDLLVIEGNKLVIYMPDVFGSGKLVVSDAWNKAK